ncbi:MULTISPECIES: helix-turn-helix domain-containing protein [Dickeya]|uniref:helix-turn-helix domain-containing protein n=1 Tax=Dickeya TaxID=204037 RepID=UPI001CF0EC09|nr:MULTISPECIES: helix-turn-helix domain-containing protein [Dickeya]MCA6987593.1 helix-turn-helix domain-containing protein [Dickeya zeae]UCZ77496.1 helix-turn-helix domain-containing protein [Dickeya zeae]
MFLEHRSDQRPEAKKKLSQEELSELSLESKCYISISTVKRAELGKPISRQTLCKFAKFFDVTVDNLILPSDERVSRDVTHDECKCIAFIFAGIYNMLVMNEANKT